MFRGLVVSVYDRFDGKEAISLLKIENKIADALRRSTDVSLGRLIYSSGISLGYVTRIGAETRFTARTDLFYLVCFNPVAESNLRGE